MVVGVCGRERGEWSRVYKEDQPREVFGRGKPWEKWKTRPGVGLKSVAVVEFESNTLRLYLTCIRNTLEAAMCLQNFPCQEVERHNKPEVELNVPDDIGSSHGTTSPDMRVKQADELENILTKKFLRFLSMRAEAFQVLRRKPVQMLSNTEESRSGTRSVHWGAKDEIGANFYENICCWDASRNFVCGCETSMHRLDGHLFS
ncbi:hypothetical protein TEA_003740 [Camellia sinensis var. sinensis]|uniref:Uncharacterized protein n=1 Tax=Camellia sinensis var. sinensis TaxID=542762 RepID=A0A4S4DLJ2_CAMSN|nr:hypothetical protein TEA_003740 [Camellia sinensis var. sinensis]